MAVNCPEGVKMKTKKQWDDSKQNFKQFVNPGDQIDSELFYYFLEVLPPAAMLSGGFLVGEPYNTDENGNFQYDCFYEMDRKYFYKGLITRKAFLNP